MPGVMVRWLDGDGSLCSGDEHDIGRARDEAIAWLWIDVTDPDESTMALLTDEFGFHQLAVEDVAHPQARAKLDSYPDGLFLAWLTPVRPAGDGIESVEIDTFIGSDYLVTLHRGENAAVSKIAESGARSMKGGPDWLLHSIIDLLVDTTMPLVDAIGDELGVIEDRMLDQPSQDDLRDLHSVRRQMVHLHRIVAPERDILRGLARESDVIGPEAYRYFQDVGDHVARLLDSIETYQDVGASVMDVFLSAQNNRMNEIMKQLTVVATIFMPLTLISGIYGMNVILGMWPPVNRVWSFGAIVGAMLVIAVAMALYFRRKQWW